MLRAQFRIAALLAALAIGAHPCPAAAGPKAAHRVATPDPNVEVWRFGYLSGDFTDGHDVFLRLRLRDKSDVMWNPVTARLEHPDWRSLDHLFLNPSVTVGGNTTEFVTDGLSARCGYTVGAHLIFTKDGQPAGSLSWIQPTVPARTTHYCGEPVRQRYDAALISATYLSDGRILIDDALARAAVILKAPPDRIVRLGSLGFLVPGSLLDGPLEKAEGRQRARYGALLHVLKTQPATDAVERLGPQ